MDTKVVLIKIRDDARDARDTTQKFDDKMLGSETPCLKFEC